MVLRVCNSRDKVATECEKCGGRVWIVNAVEECGLYMVGCRDTRCRWCEVYRIEKQ